MGSRPNNVGILAMEVYFPRTCVMQKDLEVHDRVGRGRYIIGLGQDSMAFCTDVEDVISMSLTVVHSLLEKYGVSPTRIGRLEVGSETLMDKIKSIKTFLTHIFKGFRNTEIEGADSTNACYGGTAALLNCINWVESSSWDGRYGLVVCADSAVYAEGPGRPIGGAAAVAMLVGEDAPIILESKFKGSHMPPIYDIYKPELASEYPVIDGQFSVTSYLSTLETCYYRYCDKFQKWQGKPFSLSDADYFAFQSPYNKLVQKSFARLFFIDYSRDPRFVTEAARQKLAPFSTLPKDVSYKSRDFEKAALQVTEPLYNAKVQPTTLLPKKVGNMYTASVYAALASLLHNKHDSLAGKRVVMFSYGSDLTATMFSLQLRNRGPPFSLSNIAKIMNISAKLNSKIEFTPEELNETLKLMKEQEKDYETSKNRSLLDSGTYYLIEVDSMYRRFYAKYTGEEEEEEEEEEKPSSSSMNGSLLVRPDHFPISLLEKSISKPSTSGSCSNQLFGDIFLNSLLTK